MTATLLRPLECLKPNSVKKSVLLVLNRPLEKLLLKQVWSCSVFKAVTDGGINRLQSTLLEEQGNFIPDLISGDFDSATESDLNYYRKKSVDIVNTPDQDETDFTKCLRLTIQKTQSLEVDQFFVLGSSGGRLDHHFANINTLYTASTLTSRPIYLISKGSLICLLSPGRTIIEVDTGFEDEWCGLIPIGCSCDQVTTTGLKWNLNGQTLSFGTLVSTSNAYAECRVSVETSHPLLWTMGYRFPKEF